MQGRVKAAKQAPVVEQCVRAWKDGNMQTYHSILALPHRHSNIRLANSLVVIVG
jgi:hypothetical protein